MYTNYYIIFYHIIILLYIKYIILLYYFCSTYNMDQHGVYFGMTRAALPQPGIEALPSRGGVQPSLRPTDACRNSSRDGSKHILNVYRQYGYSIWYILYIYSL